MGHSLLRLNAKTTTIIIQNKTKLSLVKMDSPPAHRSESGHLGIRCRAWERDDLGTATASEGGHRSPESPGQLTGQSPG